MKNKKDLQFLIVDTNFWLLFYEKAINIIDGIEELFEYKPFLFIIPNQVIEELKYFSTKKNKRAIAAKSALGLINKLIELKKAQIYHSKINFADSAILSLAKEKNAWVATSDKELIKKLKKRQIKIILIKDKHLVRFA
jgi:rRNA-processing protein FCF1